VLVNAIHSLTHDGVLRRPKTLDDETLAREIERLALGYLKPVRGQCAQARAAEELQQRRSPS
jgi:hypothetical protein